MKILVIDTATEACSAVLSIDGQISTQFEVCPQQHSQRILPMIDNLLAAAKLKVTELDYLGFGRGPGSFTGVRIATGMIQGLALGGDLPVVGVSTLSALAQQELCQGQSTRIAVAIDARMGEVYFAQFENRQGIATLVGEEQVLAPEDAARLLVSQTDGFAGTGWQAYPALTELLSDDAQPVVLYPNAEYMLPQVHFDIAAGLALCVDHIEPVYLRDKVTWKKLPGKE